MEQMHPQRLYKQAQSASKASSGVTPHERGQTHSTGLLWTIVGVVVLGLAGERLYQIGYRSGIEASPAYVEGKREFWGYTPPVDSDECGPLLDEAERLLRERGASDTL